MVTCSGQYGDGEVFFSTDIGTPWQNVPVDQRQTVTTCWNQAYAEGDGGGDGWVVGSNDVTSARQEKARGVATAHTSKGRGRADGVFSSLSTSATLC